MKFKFNFNMNFKFERKVQVIVAGSVQVFFHVKVLSSKFKMSSFLFKLKLKDHLEPNLTFYFLTLALTLTST